MIQNQMTFGAYSLCLFYMNEHELKHECGVVDHIGHGHLYYWTAMSSFCFQTSGHHGGEYLGPKLRPGIGFFGPNFF